MKILLKALNFLIFISMSTRMNGEKSCWCSNYEGTMKQTITAACCEKRGLLKGNLCETLISEKGFEQCCKATGAFGGLCKPKAFYLFLLPNAEIDACIGKTTIFIGYFDNNNTILDYDYFLINCISFSDTSLLYGNARVTDLYRVIKHRLHYNSLIVPE